MSRPRGYSKKGARCYGTHHWYTKGRMNVIGTIIGFTFLRLVLFGSINHSDGG